MESVERAPPRPHSGRMKANLLAACADGCPSLLLFGSEAVFPQAAREAEAVAFGDGTTSERATGD